MVHGSYDLPATRVVHTVGLIVADRQSTPEKAAGLSLCLLDKTSHEPRVAPSYPSGRPCGLLQVNRKLGFR